MSQFNLKSPDTDEERLFLVKYWLDSYKNTSPIAKMIAPKVFYKWHKKAVIHALDNRETILLVDSGDINHIIGFINFYSSDSACYINYILIKEKFRKIGLARELVVSAFEIPSHVPKCMNKPLVLTHQGNLRGLTKYFTEVIFNPYLFNGEL